MSTHTGLRRFGPISKLLLGIAVIALGVFSTSAVARALTDYEEQGGLDSCSNPIWFVSIVTYSKTTNPFVATVTDTHFEGRKMKNGPTVYFQKWNLDSAEWREWNGSSWVLVNSAVGPGVQSTGGCDPYVLDAYHFTNVETLDGGALVKLRPEHVHCWNPFCNSGPPRYEVQTIYYLGDWNYHFLE